MHLLFLIKKYLEKREKQKRRWYGGVLMLPCVVLVVTVSVTMLYSWYAEAHRLANSEESRLSSWDGKTGGSSVGYDENIYDQIIGNYQGGTDGKGIYDMAIALLNNEYLKDLLTLYTEASGGTYDTQQYHVPKEQYLSIHYNESGTYSGMSPVPDGPFPVQGGKIQYNVGLSGLPASAATWKQYNTNVMNVIGYNEIVPTNGGRDVFIFQMNKNSFGDSRGKANIDGYNAGSSRGSDPYFLPDQCTMINTQYTELVSGSSVLQAELGSNPNNVAGIMNLTHNRGSAYQAAFGLSYSPNGRRGALNVDSGSDTVMKEALVIGNDLMKAMKETGYTVTSKDLGTPYSRALAVVLLMREGWYVSPDTVSYYSGSDSAAGYFTSAWNAVYPSNTIQGRDGVKAVLSKNQGDLRTLLGISAEDSKKVYYTKGDYSEIVSEVGKSYQSGVVFKVESYTNSAYSSTYSNGATPRQVHAYDVICAGHTLMGINAEGLWEMLLKYAMEESGIDPSDPRLQGESRFDESDTFRTEAQVVTKILSKLGIAGADVDQNAFELLAMGIKASGGQYSQQKRGQQASDGTFFRDCSNLVLQAIAWTSYGSSQSVNPMGTTATLKGQLQYLREIAYTDSDWKSKIQSGDVLVRRQNGAGHTFLFVGFNQTGADVELDASLTRRNQSVTVKAGEMVTIEAYSDGYTNGIFSMKPNLKSGSYGNYAIKRLSVIT